MKPIELVRKAGNTQLLFDPHLRSYTQVHRAKAVDTLVKPGQLEIDAMNRRRALPASRLFADIVIPPPGGLGGGVSYDAGQLLFTTSTAVYFYVLVPPDLGTAPTADLLYMTSSNRASKGCEALISFFKDRNYQAAFMIWDWSKPDQPDGSKFIYTLSYDQLAPYRIAITAGGQSYDALYIVNSTRLDGANWVNEVYLHNHSTGVRELIWQNAFTWPTRATDPDFWWGPIFETFPQDANYGSAPPLGFAEALLIQDDQQRQLDQNDSTMSDPAASGFATLFEVPNATLIAKGTAHP